MASRPAGGYAIMMGTKTRSFSPLPDDGSLEDLVLKDRFYRRLKAALDLSFVRELVEPLYANGGRATPKLCRWTSNHASMTRLMVRRVACARCGS